MKPEYFGRLKRGSYKTTTIRAPEVLMRELDVYARHENDTVANLVREGILRVLDDRRLDDEYLAKMSPDKLQAVKAISEAESEVIRLQLELSIAQANLEALDEEGHEA